MIEAITALGRTIRKARLSKGLAAYEVADQTGTVHRATIGRIEAGEILRPRPETLQQLAPVLDLNIDDLLSLAGYAQLKDLPGFEPYMRTRHGDLPEAAIAELVGHFEFVAAKHRRTNSN